MSFKTEFPIISPDFITPRNFLFFIISREYIEYSSNVKCPNELFDEESKFTFYQFLFKGIKDPSVDVFKFIKENDNALKKKLSSLVVKKIELIINDLNELISYIDVLELVNNVFSPAHDRSDVIGNEARGKICKLSILGIFMKHFCLAFQALSAEKIIFFIDSFRQVLAAHGIDDNRLQLKQNALSKGQIRWALENIYNKLQDVLYDPHDDGRQVIELRKQLAEYKRMYPEIYESMFVDNLLTMHERNFATIERDLLTTYPALFLAADESLTSIDTTKEAGKKNLHAKNSQLRQMLSEVSLNCVTAYSSMGFRDEALMHYKDALLNAKASRQMELLSELGSIGNSLMPINDNPNNVFSSRATTTSDLSDKAALGNMRDLMLLSLHSGRHTLAELLLRYFVSPAPQRREISSICLVYLSIIFRSFGFESMANTYLIVAASLESIKRTKHHQDVLVELFSHLINHWSSTGQFERVTSLIKVSRTLGGGILKSSVHLESSILQSSFRQALMRLDFSRAYSYLEKLKNVSLAEFGLRKVQMFFAEDNNATAIRLGNHIISFAVHKRDLLVYNHVSIAATNSGGSMSSRITHHKSSGIIDHLNEMSIVRELPTLDDVSSQNWGVRDWAIYECRCRWLMCTQLINRQDLKTAKIHLEALRLLASKYHFYQFQRLCQVLQLAIGNHESPNGEAFNGNPLRARRNIERASSVLSSRLGLTRRDHMTFVHLLIHLYLSNGGNKDNVRSKQYAVDMHIEQHLSDLIDHCTRCSDWVGQAQCWQLIATYNGAVGNDDSQLKALSKLDMLLENRLNHVPNIDFLVHVL